MSSLRYLDDRRTGVRLAAADALGQFGTADDTEALERRLETEDEEEVVKALEQALRQIRSRQSGTQIGR